MTSISQGKLRPKASPDLFLVGTIPFPSVPLCSVLHTARLTGTQRHAQPLLCAHTYMLNLSQEWGGGSSLPSSLSGGQRGWKRQAGFGGQYRSSFGPSVELE